jgi:hypothetical protein
MNRHFAVSPVRSEAPSASASGVIQISNSQNSHPVRLSPTPRDSEANPISLAVSWVGRDRRMHCNAHQARTALNRSRTRVPIGNRQSKPIRQPIVILKQPQFFNHPKPMKTRLRSSASVINTLLQRGATCTTEYLNRFSGFFAFLHQSAIPNHLRPIGNAPRRSIRSSLHSLVIRESLDTPNLLSF